MSNNTGDRLTHRGIEVVYVATADTKDNDLVMCGSCPFCKTDSCRDAPCFKGYLLTVPDYVAWKLTK